MVSGNGLSRDFRWVRGCAVGYCVVLVSYLMIVGCAGTPRWVGGNDTNDYYFQGVGTGPNVPQAERDALFKLCASINGTDVKSVVEDFRREKDAVGPGADAGLRTESDFKQWISTYISGKVPAEARVVERWQGKGQHWAYAVVEKPGQERWIKSRYKQAMAGVAGHAFVPGWAQLQKKQPRRAGFYISGVGVGILGGISFALLSNDALERRDQAKLRIKRDHYDSLANQRFWASTGFYALAGGMYLLNVLDGMNSVVEPYQILTQIGPGGAALVFRF